MSDKTSVLVIDDDTVFCQLIQRGLERHDYLVETAHDEISALQTAEAFKADFIFLDLRLGDASGLQLIQPLLDIRGDSKIIVLTGYASITTAVTAVKRGAANYLPKPASVDEIVSAFGEPATEPAEEGDYSPMSVERLEWEHIQRVLEENDGNISSTARQLGMHRRTLQRKLQKRPKLK